MSIAHAASNVEVRYCDSRPRCSTLRSPQTKGSFKPQIAVQLTSSHSAPWSPHRATPPKSRSNEPSPPASTIACDFNFSFFFFFFFFSAFVPRADCFRTFTPTRCELDDAGRVLAIVRHFHLHGGGQSLAYSEIVRQPVSYLLNLRYSQPAILCSTFLHRSSTYGWALHRHLVRSLARKK